MTNTNCKNIKSKDRIIEAAVTLFARKGFAETGLRELAAHAEVNLAMVNYFFGSKKKLLMEILDSFFGRYLEIAQQELTGEEKLHSKIERFIISAVTFFESEQDYLLVTITELHHEDPDIVEHKASWARKMAAIIEQEISLPLAAETGQKIPPTTLGPMLISLMASRFLFSSVLKRVKTTPDEFDNTEVYARLIAQIFLNGIAGHGRKTVELK